MTLGYQLSPLCAIILLTENDKNTDPVPQRGPGKVTDLENVRKELVVGGHLPPVGQAWC